MRLYCKILYRKLLPSDHRTTASGISIRCSFGSVTVNERYFPLDVWQMTGESPAGTGEIPGVPCPWKGPAWYA